MSVFTKPVLSEPTRRPIKLPPPCVYCQKQEQLTPGGVYRIDHDYSKHPGFNRPDRHELTTEELMGVPDYDFARFPK